MDQHPEIGFQETVSKLCNEYRSLNINDATSSEDASVDGQRQLKKRKTASVEDHRLHGFSGVPVSPPALDTSPCSDVIYCAGVGPSKPSSSLINRNASPLSPPAKGDSTEISPLSLRAPLCRCISDALPVTSPPKTGVISSGQGELPKPSTSLKFPHSPPAPAAAIDLNVSPPPPSPAKAGYAGFPPLPPLRRCASDVLPIASPSRAAVISRGQGHMPTTSPVMNQESPNHERYKRMMERMKEIKRWSETVALEAEGAESHHNNTATTEGPKEVRMERDGEYLRIYMKCPCSKAYQILISESHCYYNKLI